LKFPSWSEFKEGLNIFENDVLQKISDVERELYAEKDKLADKIQKLKDDHPVFDLFVKKSIPFLPYPFNGIAQAIYDNLEGPKKDKFEEVLKFLYEIRGQSVEHYEKITSQLGSVLAEISSIKSIVAKESTLQDIKDILTGNDTQIDQNLNSIRNDVTEIKKIYQDLENDLLQRYGLSWLQPDYFQLYKSTEKDLEQWEKGFPFNLAAIKDEKEFRRTKLLDNIKSRLEVQRSLSLVGGSGTSKSTILMEFMCDYFDAGYEILYNNGPSDIEGGDQLVNFIENMLKNDQKVFVAVDDAHDESKSLIYYVMDKILSISDLKLVQNIRFLITAQIPEYDLFVKERMFSGKLQQDVIRAITKIASDKGFRYDIPYFSEDDIRQFVKLYDRTIDTQSKEIDERSKVIFQKTKGHPIMVKFAVVQQGLDKDVEDKYPRYLRNPENIHAMLVCSLLDISNLPISDDLLDKMGLLEYVEDLDQATVFQDPNGLWKTIHARWSIELLLFLYHEADLQRISVERKRYLKKIFRERINYLKKAIQSIFDIKDKKITLYVVRTMYFLASLNPEDIAGKRLPMGIIEEVMSDQMADHESSEIQAKINSYRADAFAKLRKFEEAYAIFKKTREIDSNALDESYIWYNIGIVCSELSKYQEAIDCYDKAIEIQPNFSYAWDNKGDVLSILEKYAESNECHDKAIEIDPKNSRTWTNKGLALYGLRKYQDAIECFDKAIEIDPNNSKAWHNKGLAIEYLNRDYQQAIIYYDKSLSIEPKNSGTWNSKGCALQRLQKHKDALDCFDKAIEIDPNNSKAWHNKGVSLSALGKYQDAIEAFDKAIEIDSKTDYLFYSLMWKNKGLALSALGRYQDAIEAFDKAIEIDPRYGTPWHNKGLALSDLGRYEEAVVCYDKAIEIDPNNIVAALDKKMVLEQQEDKKFKEEIDASINASECYNKGLALYELGMHQKALVAFNKALEINPNDAAAWYDKGLALHELGKYKEAIASFDKAIEFNPNNDPDIWIIKGNILDNMGKYHEAAHCYDKAIEIDPNNIDAWYNKGVCLDNLKEYDEAIKCLDRVLTSNSNHYYAWNVKGWISYELGEYEEAMKSFEKVLEINPKYVPAWYNKGLSLSNLGRFEEAIVYYDEVIKANPNHVPALNNKGMALSNLGRFEEAISCHDKVLGIDPSDAAVWYNKGMALRILERYEDAIESFDRAVEIDPEYLDAWQYKGLSLGYIGRHEEANEAFEKILEAHPDNGDALYGKGMELSDLGRDEEALECLDKAIEIVPNNVDALNVKAWILANMDKHNEALLIIEKALTIDPNYAAALDTKGFILYEFRMYREAISFFEKALAIEPEYLDARKHRDLAIEKLQEER
jgi:tetratricopeptide (TPR) repeat protein